MTETLIELDVISFFRRLVDHSQFKSLRRMIAGSSVEVSNNAMGTAIFKLNPQHFDVDILYYETDFYAFPRGKVVPETCGSSFVIINTEGVHPGFARLIDVNNKTELQQSKIFTDPPVDYIHARRKIQIADKIQHSIYECSHGNGDYIKSSTIPGKEVDESFCDVNTLTMHRIIKRKIQCDDLGKMSMEKNANATCIDHVFAIHCPYWPKEAAEWVTRKRVCGFPSKTLIKQIVRYGCDFVPIAHKYSISRNEWRFSFSKAEHLIIRGWMRSQRIVFRTLRTVCKIIESRIDNTHMRTFFFKTMMLWACEEKLPEFWHQEGDEFWQKEAILISICGLIESMAMALKAKMCQNYFIRNNNMMDHLIETDVSKEIDELYKIYLEKELIAQVFNMCFMEELTNYSILYFELPLWLKRSLIIYSRVSNAEDNFAYQLSKCYPFDLQSALTDEFSDICFGLHHQHKSTDCATTFDTENNVYKAKRYLTNATSTRESKEMSMLNEWNANRLITHYYWFLCESMHVNPNLKDLNLDVMADKLCAFNANNCLKCLTYDLRGREQHDNSMTYWYFPSGVDCVQCCHDHKRWYQVQNCHRHRDAAVIIFLYSVEIFLGTSLFNKTPEKIATSIHCFQEWPGISPTVNISWFVANAYMTNFYYATEGDCKKTMALCEHIVAVYKQSHWNRMFAENTFPVILSTQWTGVYDKEIQQILGFYSLCEFILDTRSSRCVFFGVCPITFIHYIMARCLHDETPSECPKLLDYQCKCDKIVARRAIVLITAIRTYVGSSGGESSFDLVWRKIIRT